MSDYSDDEGEMTVHPRLDDATIEALLSGRPVPAELDALTAFVSEVRAVADQPVQPSSRLAAMMASGVFTEPDVCRPAQRGTGQKMWRRTRVAAAEVLATVAAKLAGLGVVAKGVAVATVAVASVSAAGATGALPDGVQDRFDNVVERITPADDRPEDERPEHPDNFGGEVSEDARDGGVDGGEISEKAKLNGNRPTDAGRPSHAGKPSAVPPGPPSHAGRPTDVTTGPPAEPGKPTDVPKGPPADAPGGRPTPAPTP